eukprot:RCo015553
MEHPAAPLHTGGYTKCRPAPLKGIAAPHQRPSELHTTFAASVLPAGREGSPRRCLPHTPGDVIYPQTVPAAELVPCASEASSSIGHVPSLPAAFGVTSVYPVVTEGITPISAKVGPQQPPGQQQQQQQLLLSS